MSFIDSFPLIKHKKKIMNDDMITHSSSTELVEERHGKLSTVHHNYSKDLSCVKKIKLKKI